jgi:glycosyltransferase involved in cell wall biosynthesis
MERRSLAKVWQFDVKSNLPEAEQIFQNGAYNADIIWFGRNVSKGIVESVETLQSDMGKKIIFDLDDNVFDISPWSAHYETFGTEEVEIDGKHVWKDKININIPENIERKKHTERFLSVASAVSVTTPVLMNQYKPFAKKIFVFPNAMDMKAWDIGKKVQRDPNRIQILWQGGVSHYEDFWEIIEVIPEITRKYPQVHWVMMGAQWEHFWKDVPKDRYEYLDWVMIEAYPYRMQLIGADIGICPLRDTSFNRCKSSIKYYEHAALGIPTVASNIPPYADDIEDGKTGYLATTKDEWVDKLSRLIEDPIERARMGSEAKRYVMRERSVEVVAPLIVKAMEAHVNGKGLVV